MGNFVVEGTVIEGYLLIEACRARQLDINLLRRDIETQICSSLRDFESLRLGRLPIFDRILLAFISFPGRFGSFWMRFGEHFGAFGCVLETFISIIIA